MTLFDDEFLVRQVVQQISNYFSLTSRELLSYQMYGLDGGGWLQLERELQDDGGDDDTEEKTEAKAIYANVCNDGILQTC